MPGVCTEETSRKVAMAVYHGSGVGSVGIGGTAARTNLRHGWGQLFARGGGVCKLQLKAHLLHGCLAATDVSSGGVVGLMFRLIFGLALSDNMSSSMQL